MEDISPWVAACLGMFAGVIAFGAVNRWVLSIYLAATGRDTLRRNAPPRPPEQRSSVLPIIFLDSGLWVLLGALGATTYILSRPHPAWWHWFFAVAYAVPVVIYAISFAAMSKQRRKAQGPPNAA